MALVDYDKNAYLNTNPGFKPTPIPADSESLWAAAARQENSIYAFIDLVSRDVYEPDPEWDFKAAYDASPLARGNVEPFFVAQSQAEFDAISARVSQEMKDRNTIAASGWAGIGAAMVMGIMDPTVLLPGGVFTKGASALKVGTSAAAWTLVGTGAQEAVLQSSQELRTFEESAANIAGGMVLAGILGGAVGGMSKARFDRMAVGMAGGPDTAAILPHGAPSSLASLTPKGAEEADAFVGPRAAGADVVTPEWEKNVSGGLAPAFGLEKALAPISPILRNFEQKISPTVHWMQAQMDSGAANLRNYVDGVAAAPGGDVLSRSAQWSYLIAKSKQADKVFYKDYRMAGGQGGIKEFNTAIGRALEVGGASDDPMVKAAAAYYRDEIFIPIFKEAKELGMEGFDKISAEEAMRYFPRNVRKILAGAEREDFIQILSENALERVEKKWHADQQRVSTRADGLDQQAADIQLDEAGEAAVRTEVEDELTALDVREAEAAAIETEIKALRAEANLARNKKRPEERARLLAEASALVADRKPTLASYRKAQKALKKRLRNLNQTKIGLERKEAVLLGRIEAAEDAQLATLETAQRTARKLLDKIDTLSDDAIEEQLTKLQTQLDRADKVMSNAEKRLDKMAIPREYAKWHEGTKTQRVRGEKREKLSDKLDSAIDEGVAKRQAVQDSLDALNERTIRVMDKRAVRTEDLRQRRAAIDPASAARTGKQIADRAAYMRSDFMDKAAEVADTSGKKFGDPLDYSAMSREIGEHVAAKLLGENGRSTFFGNLGERGAEIARTLQIDPNYRWSNGRTYGEFINYDIEQAATKYVRTMGSDMELFRKFGTVDPLNADGKLMQAIHEDFQKARVEAQQIEDPTERANRELEISKTFRDVNRDLQAVVDRIRHVRGQPADPEGVAFRAGRVFANLNVMRYMGSVVLSSIPDIARPIMEHGLTNTFKHGFLPLVNDFKNIKLSLHELQAAGTALDLTIHGRSAALYDAFDEFEYGTMGEKFLQNATNKFGLVSGFDHWNVAMKTFAGNITMARLQDSMRVIMEGGSPKEVANANRFLASNNLGPNEIEGIWKQMLKEGGSTKTGEVRLPNTEVWDDVAAVRAYRAAIKRNVDDTIVTPGTELPLWTDANQLARLFSQFHSFTYSSTSKILLSGAQEFRQGNMAPVVGTVFSLALGAFSYYTYAMSRGGRTEERMRNMTELQWANEAFKRSGVSGVFSELYAAAERVPQVFGGDSPSAFAAGPFEGQVLGPTFGGMVGDADAVLRGDTGAAWKLAPYNNLWWVRSIFSGVDKMGGDFPRDIGIIK